MHSFGDAWLKPLSLACLPLTVPNQPQVLAAFIVNFGIQGPSNASMRERDKTSALWGWRDAHQLRALVLLPEDPEDPSSIPGTMSESLASFVTSALGDQVNPVPLSLWAPALMCTHLPACTTHIHIV